MNIVIRTDASFEIGTGHVMRCLTLAHSLKSNGYKVIFICRNLTGNYISKIKREGFEVYSLPSIKKKQPDMHWIKKNWKQDAVETCKVISILNLNVNYVIVDHYGLDINWEKHVRNMTERIMVIDDLADREHECHLILDMTYKATKKKYLGLIPHDAIGLFGVKYSLLRDQFKNKKKKRLTYNEKRIKIHVFFGGADPENHTSKYSNIILENFPNTEILAVVSGTFEFIYDLEKIKKNYGNRFSWEKQVENMALNMSQCDIALGAPGTTTWERACVGLPSAYLSVNMNQIPILLELEKEKFCLFIGEAGKISKLDFIKRFKVFINSKKLLEEFFLKGINHIDGYGVERVVRALELDRSI